MTRLWEIITWYKPESESKHAEDIGQRSIFSNASLCKPEERTSFDSENLAHLYDRNKLCNIAQATFQECDAVICDLAAGNLQFFQVC